MTAQAWQPLGTNSKLFEAQYIAISPFVQVSAMSVFSFPASYS